MNWTRLSRDEQIANHCASDICDNHAEWRMEAGGVGLLYCDECKGQIELDRHLESAHSVHV